MDDPHHGLQRIREQRQERKHFAAHIEEGLSRSTFYSTDRTRLGRTIRQALHEDEQYLELTGERLPEEHARILRIELSYWMEYDDLLRADTVPEEQYASFCERLRPRAAQLTRLLAIEEELLGSPLIAHYAMQVAGITGGTATTSPTRNPQRALVQVREDRHDRRTVAHTTYRHALRGTFFDAGTTDLTYGVRHASEDQGFYEDATGETYPPHGLRANRLEQALWRHLLAVHERGATNPARSCRRLTPLARILERTLEVEDDLLTTPLAAHYERRLYDLERAARRTDRTFRAGEQA